MPDKIKPVLAHFKLLIVIKFILPQSYLNFINIYILKNLRFLFICNKNLTFLYLFIKSSISTRCLE